MLFYFYFLSSMNINLCRKKITNVGIRPSFIPKFLRTYNWIVYVEYARPWTQWIYTGRSTIPIYHETIQLEYKFIEKNEALRVEKMLYTNFNCTRCGENINKCMHISSS